MDRVKAPVCIEILPSLLGKKEEPLKRNNVFGRKAVEGIRSWRNEIVATFILHEKTVGQVFMGQVKMVG